MTLIFTTGSVLVFRPLTQRLADLLDLMIQERRKPMRQLDEEEEQRRQRLASIENRISMLEEWQDLLPAVHQERHAPLPDANSKARQARPGNIG